MERYNVVWNTPGKDHNDSMPLGNGDIGLNAWVDKNGDLLFYISKTDSWDDNGRLLKVGRQTLAAVAIAVMFYNSGNYGLPLAELAYPSSNVTTNVFAGTGRPARCQRRTRRNVQGV